ncbi:YbjQ family protein [Acinetobacter towneri]|uniref:YbjQ family protein n=1 Tax=Acinetobacter towneri TaxID=202956 RepID=UPI001CE02E8B|nr:heavy metal-binding domain-containing protein [Acinetobacter towneri]MCA4778779.1 YbjQ family protein [Acinetobacter towneri]MCA4784145.1 YbjQ family protein [Acinetobacter towneri]MCA4787938.1 YbjQ family protein [Acinetobacter towneri]MCA4795355.1 YbjQ family protein [Acinetobacter towneri]MCA4800377.1 YbjQ family protein [Acinetobacter towneri]
MDNLILQIVVFAILFAVGFGFGRHNERKHFKYLAEQELRLSYIQIDNNRFQTSPNFGQLIHSNVVISHDYFKFAIANIQNFFGGRLTSYESIVERARREAIVRLKLEAEKMGANHIMGLRLSTTELGMQGGMVEVFAYGTAVQNSVSQFSAKR